jgi:hypothetical protein
MLLMNPKLRSQRFEDTREMNFGYSLHTALGASG